MCFLGKEGMWRHYGLVRQARDSGCSGVLRSFHVISSHTWRKQVGSASSGSHEMRETKPRIATNAPDCSNAALPCSEPLLCLPIAGWPKATPLGEKLRGQLVVFPLHHSSNLGWSEDVFGKHPCFTKHSLGQLQGIRLLPSTLQTGA